jgi:hypothetical protein
LEELSGGLHLALAVEGQRRRSVLASLRASPLVGGLLERQVAAVKDDDRRDAVVEEEGHKMAAEVEIPAHAWARLGT